MTPPQNCHQSYDEDEKRRGAMAASAAWEEEEEALTWLKKKVTPTTANASPLSPSISYYSSKGFWRGTNSLVCQKAGVKKSRGLLFDRSELG